MAANIDPKAMYKLTYGLFVLTAKDGQKDNGCIINTASQITSAPVKISIAVNKANLTHDMIIRTGMFNVSVLTESTPFSLFERFGFQSGKNADKFAADNGSRRAENGLLYITEHVSGVMCAKVTESIDCGTHTLFIGEVTEAFTLSDEKSVTYGYYLEHIKPKPESAKKTGYVCKICGYVFEGEALPPDFICPWCKHGATDFEKS